MHTDDTKWHPLSRIEMANGHECDNYEYRRCPVTGLLNYKIQVWGTLQQSIEGYRLFVERATARWHPFAVMTYGVSAWSDLPLKGRSAEVRLFRCRYCVTFPGKKIGFGSRIHALTRQNSDCGLGTSNHCRETTQWFHRRLVDSSLVANGYWSLTTLGMISQFLTILVTNSDNGVILFYS